MFHVIKEARVEAGRRVRLRFADGRSGMVDLSELISRGGVFARLANDADFARMHIGEGGRWLEWPGEIDLCADALYESLQRSQN